jgi:hypothetical protein
MRPQLHPRKTTDRAENALCVDPGNTFADGEFHHFEGFPRAAGPKDLGLVGTDNGFSQRIIADIADTPGLWFDAGFGQSLSATNADILGEFNRFMQHWLERYCDEPLEATLELERKEPSVAA